ncbi:hypothetical protein R70723_01440 [Paenibacillus sp. FSL R7-0273]|uniref:DUF6376 family protein n=1 Tax=Paenibacillus sp. FSL R7-0273 TaxID=1536772 RepID=UPI0004F89818|nr:DUF6376 family protein [Paenibacillus sp. FSL R7-0273]AIQ44716.1 hypothetical protein R70723_01440 [Paenibacillus sp. FSL R7-0273]OMF93420.1 hypothetical protein BK144_12045 [Paenibacillus sp. FSL R7-0273]
MKKYGLSLLLFILLIVPGCGFAEKVENSVTFASDTASYMQTLTAFGQEMETLATDAATDTQAREALTERLNSLKEQISDYANLQVPEYATELHQSIVSYNDKLQQGLDQAANNLEDGKAAFESTGIPETISQINGLLNQISQLIPQ